VPFDLLVNLLQLCACCAGEHSAESQLLPPDVCDGRSAGASVVGKSKPCAGGVFAVPGGLDGF